MYKKQVNNGIIYRYTISTGFYRMRFSSVCFFWQNPCRYSKQCSHVELRCHHRFFKRSSAMESKKNPNISNSLPQSSFVTTISTRTKSIATQKKNVLKKCVFLGAVLDSSRFFWGVQICKKLHVWQLEQISRMGLLATLLTTTCHGQNAAICHGKCDEPKCHRGAKRRFCRCINSI